MLLISIGGIIFVTLVIKCSAATFDSINPDIIANNVDRSVDLSSQLAKLSHKITLQNNGKGAVESFLFSVEPNARDNLSYIGAQASTFVSV
jgi:oligosaccharyltransferase complex subunit alpha (ribophorin I)